MIIEAIDYHNKRNGLSTYAMKQYIIDVFYIDYKQCYLRNALKKGLSDDVLIKVKASYKLSARGKHALELINKHKIKLKEKSKQIKKEQHTQDKEDKHVKKNKPTGKKTYLIMAMEAMKALKDRHGSSNFAIKKYIIVNNSNLNFKQYYLKNALLNGVLHGCLIQIKASYKIS
jgi:hypothetical protein